MSPPKIVIIGAGSASFGPNTLATLLRERALHGSEIVLVDLDEQSLSVVARVSERMNTDWDAGVHISATTDRRQALAGADFVIVSIEVPPREKLWRLDWEIPLRHGLRQPYGENGGPGGFMHACRQIPPLLAIARDMEALCPQALLINYSNPLPRLCRAVTRYTAVNIVGKCHQIKVGYALAAALLREKYNFDVPVGVSLSSTPGNSAVVHQLAAWGREHFALHAIGLNHFIWIVDIRDRQTGEDLYPALRAARAGAPPSLEPLSLELFAIFDMCPAAGDTHLVEYLPWVHDAATRPWEQYNLQLYDWDANEAYRAFTHTMLTQMAAGTIAVDGLRDVVSEGAVELITGIRFNQHTYIESANIPNCGAIPNLPDEAIVEVPALASGEGLHGARMTPLPPPIAELCRRETALVELVVEAAVTGNQRLALQALLLDPMVGDIGRARAILDDYLHTFSDYLPQF